LKAVFSDWRGGKKVFKPGFQICHGKRRLSFPVGKFEIRLSRLARRKESLQGRFSNLPPQKKTFVSGGKFEIRLSRLTRRKESFQARLSNLPRQKKTFVSHGKFEIRLCRLARRKESLQARFSNLPWQKKTSFSRGKFETLISRFSRGKVSLQTVKLSYQIRKRPVPNAFIFFLRIFRLVATNRGARTVLLVEAAERPGDPGFDSRRRLTNDEERR
jgi:hypothetical protein